MEFDDHEEIEKAKEQLKELNAEGNKVFFVVR